MPTGWAAPRGVYLCDPPTPRPREGVKGPRPRGRLCPHKMGAEPGSGAVPRSRPPQAPRSGAAAARQPRGLRAPPAPGAGPRLPREVEGTQRSGPRFSFPLLLLPYPQPRVAPQRRAARRSPRPSAPQRAERRRRRGHGGGRVRG